MVKPVRDPIRAFGHRATHGFKGPHWLFKLVHQTFLARLIAITAMPLAENYRALADLPMSDVP